MPLVLVFMQQHRIRQLGRLVVQLLSMKIYREVSHVMELQIFVLLQEVTSFMLQQIVAQHGQIYRLH